MRTAGAWPVRLLGLVFLAGCALPSESPASGETAFEIPDTLAGLPPAVIAERALFDLDSGDPDRMRRARCVLLALPEGPGTDVLRARVRNAPAGAGTRLEALGLLAERGDPLDAAAAEEVVSMCLREMARPERSRRAWMLSMDRLRGMGEAAHPYLLEEARPGRPTTAEASRALGALFGEGPDHRLRGDRP